MKLRSLVLSVLVATAVVAVPMAARADFVCRVIEFPNVPNTAPARVRVLFTSAANGAGSSRTLWFCDTRANAGNTFCATAAFQYEMPDLVGLYQSLARAADSQQTASPTTTTCIGGAQGCGGAVEFGP